MPARRLGAPGAQVEQGQADEVALGRGDVGPAEGGRETGDVGQRQLDVEQPLVEQLPGRPVADRGRVAQVGVDHQRRLVEPDQLAVESPAVALVVDRVVEDLEG
jgi:hypothetical protein